MAKLDADDFTALYKNEKLFQVTPDILKPQQIVREGSTYCTVLINDGAVHNLNQQASSSWGYQFSRALQPNNSLSGDLYLSPYVYQSDMFGSPTGYEAILFETFGRRFVKMSAGNFYVPISFVFN